MYIMSSENIAVNQDKERHQNLPTFGKVCTWKSLANIGLFFTVLLSICVPCSSSVIERKYPASLEKIHNELEKEIEAENSEDLKISMLRHLGLGEAPTFSAEEFNAFQVPHHVKSKYDYLLMKHNAVHRTKRSKTPSLAGLFQSVHKNPGMYHLFQSGCAISKISYKTIFKT